MKLLVNLMKQRAVNVGVNFRGDDRCVAEHLLDRSQVGATFEQVGCEGVAENMRVYILLDPGFLSVLIYDVPDAHPAQRSAALIEKELVFTFLRLFVIQKFLTGSFDIVLD